MCSIPSAYILDSRPHLFFSGRADNACTNLLNFFVRYVRTRGIAKIVESGKTADFRVVSLPHALATHGSRDQLVHAASGSEGGRRESSLLTFAALFVSEKRDKRKAYLCFFAGEQCSPLQYRVEVLSASKIKTKS